MTRPENMRRSRDEWDELELALEQAESQAQANKEDAEHWEECFDACEEANLKHLQRIEHLEGVYQRLWHRNNEVEQLCRDMYKGFWRYFAETSGAETETVKEARVIKERMEALGLLEVER